MALRLSLGVAHITSRQISLGKESYGIVPAMGGRRMEKSSHKKEERIFRGKNNYIIVFLYHLPFPFGMDSRSQKTCKPLIFITKSDEVIRSTEQDSQ